MAIPSVRLFVCSSHSGIASNRWMYRWNSYCSWSFLASWYLTPRLIVIKVITVTTVNSHRCLLMQVSVEFILHIGVEYYVKYSACIYFVKMCWNDWDYDDTRRVQNVQDGKTPESQQVRGCATRPQCISASVHHDQSSTGTTGAAGSGSAICAPILNADGNVIAVCLLSNKQPAEVDSTFTDEDEKVKVAFSSACSRSELARGLIT